jgi:hypothetical protein
MLLMGSVIVASFKSKGLSVEKEAAAVGTLTTIEELSDSIIVNHMVSLDKSMDSAISPTNTLYSPSL